jgi:hypothetical protein
MTDIPNLTDRELLIQHGTVLTKLCGSITELKKDNADEHGKVFEKIDKVIVSKISNKLFFWLIGLMIVVQIGLIGFVGNTSIQVTRNTVDIQHVEFKVNRMHPHE